PAEAHREKSTDFELTVREVTFFDRDDRRWADDVSGVLCDQVEGGAWASLAGLRGGDLIQRFAGHDVPDLESWRAAVKSVVAKRPQRVVVTVLRGVETRFLFIEPEWKAAAGKEGTR